jgi:hypothetical protein
MVIGYMCMYLNFIIVNNTKTTILKFLKSKFLIFVSFYVKYTLFML